MSGSKSLVWAAVGFMAALAICIAVIAPKAEAAPPPDDSPAVTEFVPVAHFGRKEAAAERMSELHLEHYAKGRQVIDVAPYVQQGDLQGFFVTYVAREN